MADRLHLVRHGAVDNPDHLVYASLPGFDLSPEGLLQAKAASRYLGRRPIVAVWSSPIERALRTAELIASRLSLPVKVDDALGEWALMARWQGVSWEELPRRFPGELEALLESPHTLDFAPETLEEVAERLLSALQRLDTGHPHGDVVVVSHSGPLRATILTIEGRSLAAYWVDGEPSQGSVTTVKTGTAWSIETVWDPEPTPESLAVD